MTSIQVTKLFTLFLLQLTGFIAHVFNLKKAIKVVQAGCYENLSEGNSRFSLHLKKVQSPHTYATTPM